MKFIALEAECPGTLPEHFEPHLKTEALVVWELQQQGFIREIYFRGDRRTAVLVLECADTGHAVSILSTLPLVQQKLVQFEIIPLVPYPGFARLFSS
jgi:hypothetical protein